AEVGTVDADLHSGKGTRESSGPWGRGDDVIRRGYAVGMEIRIGHARDGPLAGAVFCALGACGRGDAVAEDLTNRVRRGGDVSQWDHQRLAAGSEGAVGVVGGEDHRRPGSEAFADGVRMSL